MSEFSPDFSNYNLERLAASPAGVYGLAGGVLPQIAEAAQIDIGDEPSAEAIRNLIGAVGPDKELQKNIGTVLEVLGDQATERAADWVDQSGVLSSVSRPFVSNDSIPLANPKDPFSAEVDTAIIPGGIANWMLRRRNWLERFDPAGIGEVYLPTSMREMGPAEHKLVNTHSLFQDRKPTETEFARVFIQPLLERARFTVYSLDYGLKDGEQIMRAMIQEEIREDPDRFAEIKLLVVGNAPSVIQAAGQVRQAAREADPTFDEDGSQLFMTGDTIPVARNQEGTATHQNPLTALGQIARNALYLHVAAEEIRDAA